MLQSVSYAFFLCTIISHRCLQFALHISNTVFWHDVRWCRPLLEKKEKNCHSAIMRQRFPAASATRRQEVRFLFVFCVHRMCLNFRAKKLKETQKGLPALSLGLDLVKRNLGSTFLSDDSFEQVMLKSGTVRCLFVGTALFLAGICITNRTVFKRYFMRDFETDNVPPR